MTPPLKLGDTFGRYTVIELLGPRKARFRCECGTTRVYKASDFNNGKLRACRSCAAIGRWAKERATRFKQHVERNKIQRTGRWRFDTTVNTPVSMATGMSIEQVRKLLNTTYTDVQERLKQGTLKRDVKKALKEKAQ